MHKYRLVAKKGEGTFSEVLKAQCIKNGKYVAIKCMKVRGSGRAESSNHVDIQTHKRLLHTKTTQTYAEQQHK